MLQNKFPCRNEKECIWRVIDNEGVIISEDGQWLHKLNNVGLEIWKMCDGTLDIAEITDNICNEFGVDKEVGMADVQSYIDELSEKGLITLKSTKSKTRSSQLAARNRQHNDQ